MAIPAESERPDVTMVRCLFEGRSEATILGDLANGIVGCTRNARRLLDDAAFLVQAERYATATFVTTTATEEIAKAYILLDACGLVLLATQTFLRGFAAPSMITSRNTRTTRFIVFQRLLLWNISS